MRRDAHASRGFACAWLCRAEPASLCPRARRSPSPQPQVVDRIVAHIEDDIITLSEVRELAAYQQLVDGHAESDDRILNELIEQWVVNNEATAAQFPPAAESEVDREVARIQGALPEPRRRTTNGSPRWDSRPKPCGAWSRGRSTWRATSITSFARPCRWATTTSPNTTRNNSSQRSTAKGQTAPPLSNVTEQIRELLVQQGVSERAASWFDETKSRLKIEIEPAHGGLVEDDAMSATTPKRAWKRWVLLAGAGDCGSAACRVLGHLERRG